MEVMIIFLLILLLVGLGFLVFKLIKWTLANKRRFTMFSVLLAVCFIALIINNFFFRNMEFLPSKVYQNLYLVKNPVKDTNLLYQAIEQKIVEHMNAGNPIGRNLTYSSSQPSIFFYEYSNNFAFNIFQDAGTAYFLENEEDLGGFVSEELGMYTQYRLAEVYYDTCKTDSIIYCAVVDYFHEGEFVREDSIHSFISLNIDCKEGCL